jgi:DNA processing protein
MNQNFLNELKLWLVPGMGEAYYYKILNFYNNDLNLLFSRKNCLPIELKLSKKIRDFLNTDLEIKNLDILLEKELEIANKYNIKIIKKDFKEYPNYLKNIYNPPPFLFVKGDIKKLSNKCIGIVGSRNPSEYGKKVTKMLSSELAINGLTVVSGLARGIDAIAHQNALEYGNTVAVIGSGFKYIYPSENKILYEKILEKNTIITEFPFDIIPEKFNFPIRNRIISGLSHGVVVIEATENSGSLITAMYALEQGRDVFAVPGEITNSRSVGTNKLIRDGAKIVLSVDDILEEFLDLKNNSSIKKEEKTKNNLNNINELEKTIYDIIFEKNNIQFDELINILDVDKNISEIMNALLNLQLQELITEMPGKYYSI